MIVSLTNKLMCVLRDSLICRYQEYSFPRLFVPWNIRSLDRSFHGTFVPGTLDLSCRGPFVHLSAKQYLFWNSVTNRSVGL